MKVPDGIYKSWQGRWVNFSRASSTGLLVVELIMFFLGGLFSTKSFQNGAFENQSQPYPRIDH